MNLIGFYKTIKIVGVLAISFGGFEVYYRILTVHSTDRLPLETEKHCKACTKQTCSFVNFTNEHVSCYGLAALNLKFSPNILQRKDRLDGCRLKRPRKC